MKPARVILALLLLLPALAAVPAQAWPLRPSEAGLSFFNNRSLDIDRGNLYSGGLEGHLALPLHAGSWYRLDLELEMAVGGFCGYNSAFEVSLVPGLRFYLGPGWAVQPYCEAGAGVDYNNLDIPELGTGFNFITFGGLGVRVPLLGSTSLDLGYRLRHISNAGLDERNHGVTSHQVQAGLAWSF